MVAGATYKSCQAQRVRYDYERLAKGEEEGGGSRQQGVGMGGGRAAVGMPGGLSACCQKFCSTCNMLQVGGVACFRCRLQIAILMVYKR